MTTDHSFSHGMVTLTHSDVNATFFIRGLTGHKIAIADISLLMITDDVVHLNNKRWYYFNRINVPKNFQPKNASVLLYNAICKYADHFQINIYNEVAPYAHSLLNTEDLIRFEHLFGFVRLSPDKNVTIRLAKEVSWKKN